MADILVLERYKPKLNSPYTVEFRPPQQILTNLGWLVSDTQRAYGRRDLPTMHVGQNLKNSNICHTVVTLHFLIVVSEQLKRPSIQHSISPIPGLCVHVTG
jgi:hypothetical protein